MFEPQDLLDALDFGVGGNLGSACIPHIQKLAPEDTNDFSTGYWNRSYAAILITNLKECTVNHTDPSFDPLKKYCIGQLFI